MNEGMPEVLFVIVGVEDGKVDRCERCQAELSDQDLFIITIGSPPDHEAQWVACGECWEALARVWWRMDAPTSSRTSAPWPPDCAVSSTPGWAPQAANDEDAS